MEVLDDGSQRRPPKAVFDIRENICVDYTRRSDLIQTVVARVPYIIIVFFYSPSQLLALRPLSSIEFGVPERNGIRELRVLSRPSLEFNFAAASVSSETP